MFNGSCGQDTYSFSSIISQKPFETKLPAIFSPEVLLCPGFEPPPPLYDARDSCHLELQPKSTRDPDINREIIPILFNSSPPLLRVLLCIHGLVLFFW